MRIGSVVAIALVLGTASVPRAQMPAAPRHPSFAGTWAPSDPDKSNQLFNVGLSSIPGSGRMTIEQRDDRFTVTIALPDDKLEAMLRLTGRYYPTTIYRVPPGSVRVGGTGAGGPPPLTDPTWMDDKLVIPNARQSARPVTTTYALDGERLKVESQVEIGAGRSNTVTEWFTRVTGGTD